jgi:hypothetical protein
LKMERRATFTREALLAWPCFLALDACDGKIAPAGYT